MADAYYRQIAALLGLPPPVINGLLPDVAGFWALTARDIHFTSRHPAVQRLTFDHDLSSALLYALSRGEHDYAAHGGHLRDRLNLHWRRASLAPGPTMCGCYGDGRSRLHEKPSSRACNRTDLQ